MLMLKTAITRKVFELSNMVIPPLFLIRPTPAPGKNHG